MYYIKQVAPSGDKRFLAKAPDKHNAEKWISWWQQQTKKFGIHNSNKIIIEEIED